MISPIQPGIFDALMEPHHEGAKRINLAWEGLDWKQDSILLKDRVSYAITGAVLYFAIVINFIVWVVWNTFGTPDTLSGSLVRSLPQPPQLPRTVASQPAPLDDALPLLRTPSPSLEAGDPIPPSSPSMGVPQPPPEQFFQRETIDGRPETLTWKIEHHPHGLVVEEDCPSRHTKSYWDLNTTLTKFERIDHANTKEFTAVLEEGKIRLDIKKEGRGLPKIEHVLPPDYSWIQQVTIGFKPFITSHQPELYYCFINPTDFSLEKLYAKNMGTVSLKVGNPLSEMTVQATHIAVQLKRLVWFPVADIWYDPEGTLLKMETRQFPGYPHMLTELQLS